MTISEHETTSVRAEFNTEDSLQGPSASSFASTLTQNTAQITPLLQLHLTPRYDFHPNRLFAQFPKENIGFDGSRTWIRLLRRLTTYSHHNHHIHLFFFFLRFADRAS